MRSRIYLLGISFSAIVLLFGNVVAQDRIGAKVGLNLDYVDGDHALTDTRDPGIGLLFGITFKIPVNKNFTFQPELLLTEKGLNRSYIYPLNAFFTGTMEISEHARIWYLEVPLIAKFPFPMKGSWQPAVYAGSSVALRLFTSADGSYSTTPAGTLVEGSFDAPISNAEWFDYAILAGWDVTFPLMGRQVTPDLRYTLGLTDVFKEANISDAFAEGEEPVANYVTGETDSVKNSVFSFTLGMPLPL